MGVWVSPQIFQIKDKLNYIYMRVATMTLIFVWFHLHLDKGLLQKQNTRELQWLKTTARTHSWGKLWTKPNENKNLTASSGVSGAKPSSTRTTKQVGSHPQAQPYPFLPSLYLRDPVSLESKQEYPLLVFPPNYSTSPSKALLEFLTWFLIHICGLRSPRTLVSNIRWWKQSWISLGTILDLLWGLKHTYY